MGVAPDCHLECLRHDLSSMSRYGEKALEKVPGVSKIEVRYEKKQMLVTFDDAKTDANALVKATTDAGYPSQVEKGSK